MNQETRLYHFACMFLWWVLSASDYLFENNIDSAELRHRYQQDYWSEDLAEWLLQDELLSIGDCEDISEEEAKLIYSRIEDFQPLVLGWADRVKAAALDAGVPLNKETRLYYFICGWSLRTLLEFERLIGSINSSKLHQRYLSAHTKFEGVSQWLKNELAYVSNCESLDREVCKVLRAAMQMIVEQLTIEWHNKVYELARM
jgi:hypothetical protein